MNAGAKERGDRGSNFIFFAVAVSVFENLNRPHKWKHRQDRDQRKTRIRLEQQYPHVTTSYIKAINCL